MTITKDGPKLNAKEEDKFHRFMAWGLALGSNYQKIMKRDLFPIEQQLISQYASQSFFRGKVKVYRG